MCNSIKQKEEKMKRLLIGLLTLFTMGGEAMAQVVTVADVEALPGETVSFSVNLSEGKADTYTAMTLYAQFPVTGFTTTGAYTISSSWIGATATIGEVDGTGLATIPFASSNPIPGTAVDNLVTISFNVGAGVAIGDYDVTLSGTLFEYGTSDKDYAADVTFQVHVVASHTIVLDETSTTAPESATDVKVRVKRTIKADEWSTICLPFPMTTTEVKAAFGEDVQLGDFNGYSVKEDDSGIVGITVNFNSVTAIEKNHPYIIKVSTAVTEFTVDGVDIDPQDAEINKGTSRKPKAFIGNYVAGTAIANGCLFLNNNKFWYSVGTTTIKGYRAYFDFFDLLTNFEENFAAAPVFISFDNMTTGIYATQKNEVFNNNYFNLNGQRVLTPTNGLYIKKNKKVVIK